jgi:hypothetical protein
MNISADIGSMVRQLIVPQSVAWPSALAAKRNARFHGSFDGDERKA